MAKQENEMLSVGALKLNGFVDYYVNFIENFHLKDESLWRKFENVFRDKEDIVDNGWRGEYWGKQMRGACVCYYYSQDERLYRIIKRTVEEMINLQEDSGRISSYTVEKEFNGWDLWARKYVATGLIHFYYICKEEDLKLKIVETLRGHLDYLIDRLGDGEGKKCITQTSDAWGGVNSCSILEPVIGFYNMVKEEKYLEFAKYIISTGGSSLGSLIDAASDKERPLVEYPVLKAYEVISFFEGVLEYYKVCKEEKYLTIVENFLYSLQKNEISVIGCAGCWGEEYAQTSIKQTEIMQWPTQETCVTVTLMRIYSKMHMLTGEVKYLEYFEKSALNGLYGSVNVNKLEGKSSKTENAGIMMFDSYSPLIDEVRNRGVGGFKDLKRGGYYGCCACIGAVAVGLVPLMSALGKDGNLLLNYYYSGHVALEKGFSVSISSDYPVSDDVQITINESDAKERSVIFRVPEWCDEFVLKTDSKTYKCEKGYFELKKVFRIGETIKIKIKKSVKRIELNGFSCFTYGPIVLCRDDKKESIESRVSAIKFDPKIENLEINRLPEEELEMVRFEIGDENQKIILTDYASCGKNWDTENRVSVWLKQYED
ncbi:MAG: glycoside hydrolase family 127 protein [Clostridia bacterium]|nr:glycoside hydrolase family 127 protein [Clostridia bacterium]